MKIYLIKKITQINSMFFITLLYPASVLAVQQTDVAEICDLEAVFSSIVSVAGGLLGFAFFMTIVMGGIRYMFSGGDPKAVGAAKQTLTWGILGLAFFALSFTILLLVKAFTGVDVTRFKLCGY